VWESGGEERKGKEMDGCPLTCSTCRIKTKRKAITHKVTISQINACRAGAFPSMIEELDDQDEATHMNANKTGEEVQGECPAFDDDLKFDTDHIEIKEGDRVYMAMVHPVDPQHFVCASSMVSRRLAKASAKNSMPKGFCEIIPTALHSYEDVFSETAFDPLPQHQKWDHAIELERESSPGFRKVYLITLTEQTEMDVFLEEALATGRIRQSKSLLVPQSSSSRRRMVSSALSRTIKHSMPSCEKNDTPSPSSTISSIDSRACNTSPSSMYIGDTIMSTSERAMSGRPPSEKIEVSLNHWSCTLASPTAQLPFRPR
jgi:hypothetical protein